MKRTKWYIFDAKRKALVDGPYSTKATGLDAICRFPASRQADLLVELGSRLRSNVWASDAAPIWSWREVVPQRKLVEQFAIFGKYSWADVACRIRMCNEATPQTLVGVYLPLQSDDSGRYAQASTVYLTKMLKLKKTVAIELAPYKDFIFMYVLM